MSDRDSESDTEPTGDETETSGQSVESCACCSDDSAGFEYHTAKLRLKSESSLIETDGDTSVLDEALPQELQRAVRRFLGGTSVKTLGDWVTEVRRRTGGGSIDVEDLCHERETTGHWGQLDGERYHFTCFFDAVVLAALVDRRVVIRTESPSGTEIEATATGDEVLSVDPPGTLVSFGVATDGEATFGQEPTHEDVYESVCPVVKAFPTPQAYERWADSVPAATVAMPLEDATELAAALVE